MIVCSCRNIKESDFPNKEDLLKRLHEEDFLCGTCVEDYKAELSEANILIAAKISASSQLL